MQKLEDFGLQKLDFNDFGKNEQKIDKPSVKTEEEEPCSNQTEQKSRIAMFKTFTPTKKNRILSENALSEVADWYFEKNTAYHFITSGDVDSLTFLRWMLRQQPLDYVCLSTWCMSPRDAEEMRDWVARGMVKRFDFYVGEIFKNGYRGCIDILCEICDKTSGRVARFRNHSKLMACYGRDFDFVIESSANVDTNPRTEQACITTDSGLADFYIDYFNKINDFDGRYKNWKPYKKG